jgi:hypothetical protein
VSSVATSVVTLKPTNRLSIFEDHFGVVRFELLNGILFVLIRGMNVAACHLDGGVSQQGSQGQHIDASLCSSRRVCVPQIIEPKMLLNASAFYRCIVGFANAPDWTIWLFRSPRPSW